VGQLQSSSECDRILIGRTFLADFLRNQRNAKFFASAIPRSAILKTKMPDILHRVGINAPVDRVFDALASIGGLRGWWVSDAGGDAGVGGVVNFGFCQMRVLEAAPYRFNHWRCIDGPEEWLDTEVTFTIEWKDAQSFLLFKHAGWKEPVEFMAHCSTKWATFLLSLRDLLETGEGRPAPHDRKIHVGD